MFTVLLAVHIIVAIVMVGFILLQHGKGADAGASFGAGAAGTVFGAAGSANFMTRITAVLATVFFITSLALAWYAQREAEDQLRLDVPTAQSAPATTVPTQAPSAPAGE
ncbi:preprotein translocase subunit SecG [Moraxella ovis]|uniref:Protein-export membrane protein SecG n=1 Tax=Moraxella ovis TaxID=29433 RepID=A0A378PML4_9GAMM|nr:preprotein translocase subunit SecG [Moraxella ovis]ANB92190.1 preprotein translocase subunit SecG [Moraxella ovis]STY87982.1 Preprotein translocase band 1 subunit [Moraxella ovis]